MGQKILLTFFVLLVISACTNPKASSSSAPTKENSRDLGQAPVAPTLNRSDFMTGLSSPWDLAFSSEGNLFFTEKCKGLSVRHANGNVHRLFGTSGSSLVANDLFCSGQSGMHGVALDPQFQTNRFIFVYMASKPATGSVSNRVVRLKVDGTSTKISDRVDIITDISFKSPRNSWGGEGSHSGGRIRFGPDGFLYVTTGDNHNGPLPQDLSKLGGKVLRVDRNGTAAAGNATPAGADPRIYAFGFRNPQGLTFRPGTGRVFISEHGPNHSDEVTALNAGGNGGWDPKPESGVVCADNYCGYTSNKPDGSLTSMTDLAKFPNALKPTLQVSDSSGMGPATFLTGPQWKAWDGALLVGMMASRSLSVLILQKDDLSLVNPTTASLPATRFRSLVQGPEGHLYIATDEGSIWKIIPQ